MSSAGLNGARGQQGEGELLSLQKKEAEECLISIYL